MKLVVKEPFQGYKKGDVIKDADEIKNISTSANSSNCIRVSANRQPKTTEKEEV